MQTALCQSLDVRWGLNLASAFSTNRRIASGRDGFGSGCAAIQASIRAASSGRKDELNCRPFPIEGRPRFFSRTFS
jgi:hypothetical protein